MAGFRSTLPLLGLSSGASTTQPGFRGLLAFWVGGASDPGGPAPVRDDTVYGGVHKRHRSIVEFYLQKQRADKLRKKDEESADRLRKLGADSAEVERQKKISPVEALRYTALQASEFAQWLADEQQRIEEEDIVFVMMMMSALRRT